MTREEFIQRRKALNPDYHPSSQMKTGSISISPEQKERISKLKEESTSFFLETDAHAKEEHRVITVLHNAPIILDKLDKNFEERTSLTKTDWILLLVATGLQLLRIYMLPNLKEKFMDEDRIEHNNEEMKEMIKEERKQYKQDKIEKGWESKISKRHRSWQQILWEKVPYDATIGSTAQGICMHGGQHREKTLGHDPWLGWIFGVCNIMSDTITICPEYKLGEKKIRIPYIKTYGVQMKGPFVWTDPTPTFKIFTESYDSFREDKHRLYAAIFAQGVHLTSDAYSKWGLPIPFLSLIDQDKAYEIYKNGYDWLDFKYDVQLPLKTVSSAMLSILINKIIGGIHTFFYNPEKEPDFDLYAVRTRKIIMYSDVIATSSDIIQTAIRASNGDETALKNMDFGGLMVTIYRLISDISFIQKVKSEFLSKEWDKVFWNDNPLIEVNKNKIKYGINR
ncbi:MAG: hypothetical protein HDS26_04550 [Bacteroides sp.]|nr:hypothetical protein [Bacteroides sp.]MBD5306330.1 hypothetical protein [Bacteroides sp.]